MLCCPWGSPSVGGSSGSRVNSQGKAFLLNAGIYPLAWCWLGVTLLGRSWADGGRVKGVHSEGEAEARRALGVMGCGRWVGGRS